MLKRVFLMTGIAAFAQSPDVFEVASIRADKTDRPPMSYFRSTPEGGEFEGKSTALKPLLEYAYGILDHQLVGDPSWLATERFDIRAKPGSRLGQGWYEDAELRARVRALLEQRCQLKVHRESRQAALYTLARAKGGSKMKKAAEDAEPLLRVGFNRGRAQIAGPKVSMTMLAEALARTVGRSVRDETKLAGAYELELNWVADDAPAGADGPSLFTAIEEQLGLKLEAGRGAIEVVVIDRVERPGEN